MNNQQHHPQQCLLPGLIFGEMLPEKVLAQLEPTLKTLKSPHDNAIRASTNRTYRKKKLSESEREQMAERYLRENPTVYRKFCTFTWQLINAGEKRIGAKMIAERLRWDSITTKSSTDPYAVNNSYVSFMARRFMRDNPQVGQVFETREKAGV